MNVVLPAILIDAVQPLYFVALVPTFFGVLMGLAGLMALPIHPDSLVKLLS